MIRAVLDTSFGNSWLIGKSPYSQTVNQMRSQVTKYITPSLLPHRPFRFRDNLVGVARGRLKLPKVQALFEHIYGLKLQVEGQGLTLQTLESRLTIDQHTGTITVALKDKVSYHHNPEPTRRYVRYPDVYSPNARSILRSLVPALALKCTYPRWTQPHSHFASATSHEPRRHKQGLLNDARNTPHRTHTRQLLSLFNKASKGPARMTR